MTEKELKKRIFNLLLTDKFLKEISELARLEVSLFISAYKGVNSEIIRAKNAHEIEIDFSYLKSIELSCLIPKWINISALSEDNATIWNKKIEIPFEIKRAFFQKKAKVFAEVDDKVI